MSKEQEYAIMLADKMENILAILNCAINVKLMNNIKHDQFKIIIEDTINLTIDTCVIPYHTLHERNINFLSANLVAQYINKIYN